jgi:hypothetical protein
MSAVAWQAKKPKPPGPPLAVAIPLLIAGVVVAVLSAVGLGKVILRSVSNASTLSGPGSEAVVCDSGVYLLYTAAGSNVLDQNAVAVTGPGGAAVTVETEAVPESVPKDGVRYSGVLGFTATRSGTYTVKVTASGVTLLVAPSLTNTAMKNLGWLIAVGVSLVAALGGLILVVVALVQRSGARKRAAQYPEGPWGGAQAGRWGPGPPRGPPGYGWTGSSGPQPAGPSGWSPAPGSQPTGPAGWSPPSGTPGPSNAPSGPPATSPPTAPPGRGGEADQPFALPEGTAQSQGQPSGWPQPSAKPLHPRDS